MKRPRRSDLNTRIEAATAAFDAANRSLERTLELADELEARLDEQVPGVHEQHAPIHERPPYPECKRGPLTGPPALQVEGQQRTTSLSALCGGSQPAPALSEAVDQLRPSTP